MTMMVKIKRYDSYIFYRNKVRKCEMGSTAKDTVCGGFYEHGYESRDFPAE